MIVTALLVTVPPPLLPPSVKLPATV